MNLSDACERLIGGPVFGTLSLDVDLTTSDGRCRIRFDSGRVHAVESPGGPADVAIWPSDRLDRGDSPRPDLPLADGDPATSALRWLVGGPGCEPAVVPPLDHLDLTWATDLPRIPGVHVTWTAAFTDTPFGDLAMTYQVRDGQVETVSPQWDDEADVWFRFRLRRSIGARAGHFSVPETLDDGGDCSGAIDVLLLVAGLQETTAWVSARRISPERALALSHFLDLHEAGFFPALSQEFGA